MLCGNCHAQLIPGNNVCPNCGAINQINNNINEEETKTEVEELETLEITDINEEHIDIPLTKDNKSEQENLVVNEEQVKKANKLFNKILVPKLYLIVGSILLIVIGILIGKTMYTKNIYNPNVSNQTIKSNIISNGKKNETSTRNYKFKISDSYVFDKQNNGVIVYDKDATFKIFIKATKGNYDKVASSKTSIEKSLIEDEFNVNNVKEVYANQKNSYIVLETNYKTFNKLIAVTKGKNNDVFYVEIITGSNNYNYEALDVADEIIQKSEPIKDISKFENSTINDLSSLIVACSEANSLLQQ